MPALCRVVPDRSAREDGRNRRAGGQAARTAVSGTDRVRIHTMTTQTIAQAQLVPKSGLPVRQRIEFRSGNEAAALAARDIGYHVMGFFPITPSTEVAENLSKMQAEGQHEIAMIA